MTTMKEIRQRLKTPYKHEAPYYIFRGKTIGGKKYDVTLNWYEVHKEDTFYNDICTFIAQLPKELQDWINARIVHATRDGGTIAYVSVDHIFAYIDVAHFGYYGVFAE